MVDKKEISIKTIEDIVNKVPIEDIDNFMKDLKSRLTIHNVMKMFWWMAKSNDKEFKRINDWKHDANITIQRANQQ